jgi:hypothetical protein
MTACAFWSSKAVREMAASTLLSNPNRHRACLTPATCGATTTTKAKPYEEKNHDQTLDTSDLLIQNALVFTDFQSVTFHLAEMFGWISRGVEEHLVYKG